MRLVLGVHLARLSSVGFFLIEFCNSLYICRELSLEVLALTTKLEATSGLNNSYSATILHNKVFPAFLATCKTARLNLFPPSGLRQPQRVRNQSSCQGRRANLPLIN